MPTLTLTGTKPLLMASIELGNKYNEFAKEIARLNSLKGKITDEQDAERDWFKFRGAMYYDEQAGPVLPGENVMKSIRDAASLTRNGKDIERGVLMATDLAPLEYDGPRSPEALWGGGASRFVDRRMGKVNRAPIVVVRPRFDEWAATYEFEIDEDVISREDFAFFAGKAGRLIHVGTYRQRFGAYGISVNWS